MEKDAREEPRLSATTQALQARGKALRTTLSGTSCRVWQYCSYIYSPNESQWSGMTKCRRMAFHSASRMYPTPLGYPMTRWGFVWYELR